ncbi:MAG TPA: FMN-binding negative transcriptional regulator [Casimicrobiaceae bacterium]|nr:FMN-binding negative transcriptional regulator [Casimicrobiaceae bacterium]
MPFYVPRSFAVDDDATLAAFIDAYPFATLITPASPEPFVTHLPLLRDDSGGLVGHYARANPHAAQPPGLAIAIFHGPHAYVSPTWYAKPLEAVPTWNYGAVHVIGRLEPSSGAADAERVLAKLVERFEGKGPNAWRFSLEGRQRDAMIANIAPFRIAIDRVIGKFKLSQNRSDDDRRRVIDALASSSFSEAQATATLMRTYADPDA